MYMQRRNAQRFHSKGEMRALSHDLPVYWDKPPIDIPSDDL